MCILDRVGLVVLLAYVGFVVVMNVWVYRLVKHAVRDE